MARKRRTKAEILAAKSEGLGDTVEKILESTGVAKVAKWILGEDCGCDERKAKLNELFPYKKPLCLDELEYEWLTAFFSKNTNTVLPSEQRVILTIYNRIFQKRNEPTSCSSCLRGWVEDLRKIYLNYADTNS